ncbi:MAG: tRNA-specific adenosine deaminase [Candidatus Tectimicrobiota bacterium]|nr:MAG: tRNA-specific adenosine deaminase [Candidatus Tectomicrobia bacterium]
MSPRVSQVEAVVLRMHDELAVHERFMREALHEARLAVQTADVPVGAVVVVEGRIVGRGRNQREALADPTAHAEVVALRAAAQQLGTWRLTEATLYVTLEPCIMCVGAAVLSRIRCLVFACHDPKNGACGSQFDIVGARRLNHTFPVIAGVCQEEASALLSTFFRRLRQKEAAKR